MSDLTRKVFLAEVAAVNEYLAGQEQPPADRAALRDRIAADARVGEARSAIYEALAALPARDAGQLRTLLSELEGAVESAVLLRRMADEAQPAEQRGVDRATVDQAVEALRAGNHITARRLLESATSSTAEAQQDGARS